jgi:predicted metalloendopeptidase
MTFKHLLSASCLALTLSLAACAPNDAAHTEAKKEAAVTMPKLGSFGVALENMDKSVKPGDDFFRYVNGTWLKNTEIPADKSNYGSFNVLGDLSNDRVKSIIEAAAAKNAPKGSEEQKIGDFYAAFMDQDAINAAGLEPIKADLKRISDVSSRAEAAALMGDPTMFLHEPKRARHAQSRLLFRRR